MISIIKVNNRNLVLKKSYNEPNFKGKSVLVNDPWDYVDMWLKRSNNNKKEEAIFYWQQAKQFYKASLSLPLTSAPLTSYYCFLNATKALLLIRNVSFTDQHGVSGKKQNNRKSLASEIVTLKINGILPALSKCMGDTPLNSRVEHSLKELLRNLVYIHRSYCLTYTSESSKELFIPVEDSFFVKEDNSNECWFSAEIDEKYATKYTIDKIKRNFKIDDNFPDNYVVRFKTHVDWKGNKTLENPNFLTYYKEIRRNVQYIAGSSNRWYIKRSDIDESLPYNSLSITFAAMHRLSELSRYEPITLSEHLNSKQNWLLSEFISSAPYQFIHEIASEITGDEFLIPRRHLV
ncbi:MAG TPA: hypothetical protein DDY89_15425 [Lysinibacillus sp.]|nr:hypothetical protein [Lysinibacillus sp.]